MRNNASVPLSHSTRVILALAAVYVVWGSTYLAIRFAVETIPPFFMAGVRFLVAGSILYAWLRLRGAPAPSVVHWRSMSIIGVLLIGVGNGAVSWAEQTVPSGLTALIIALIPLWFVLMDWFQTSTRPTGRVVAGLFLGFIGMIVLIDPARITESGHVDLIGAAVIAIGTLAWAAGSMYSRTAAHPTRPLLGTAMQMLTGAAALLIVSAFSGELADLSFGSMSQISILSLGYLIVFGSLVAFTSYIWLLRAAPPAQVSTYAYVNPVIAVFLGWLLADELLNMRIATATVIIVAAVAIITVARNRGKDS